ncbi:LysM peptidoglycan-binding domain-containing protein [Reichenbachiella versicolor]|uniref:LysM peptidoglycan-binding domain-containing protein n=1 Tax=Reichenbachiella versicolor TaxID=1821036 RepID=UPI0013A5B0A3|nr:N-acetylmuramidase domain-containing protein [Reichenbachiella versicolor]
MADGGDSGDGHRMFIDRQNKNQNQQNQLNNQNQIAQQLNIFQRYMSNSGGNPLKDIMLMQRQPGYAKAATDPENIKRARFGLNQSNTPQDKEASKKARPVKKIRSVWAIDKPEKVSHTQKASDAANSGQSVKKPSQELNQDTTSKHNTGVQLEQETYTVKSGDSLSKIAKANNISLKELVQLNKGTLTKGLNTIIHPGDVLNVNNPVPQYEFDTSVLESKLLVESDNTFVAQRNFEAELNISPQKFEKKETKEKVEADTSKPDYAKIAKKLGVEKEVVQAIATVESSGSGFYKNGNPKVRFEGHWFRKYQKGKENFSQLQKDNSDLIYPYSDSSSKKHGSAEYEKALKLDSESAMLSTSFGAFQIMGFNFKAGGYDSVSDFVEDQKTSAGQVEAFMNFIASNKAMLKAMKEKDFAKFAKLYNGPDYKVNKYDTKMENLYNKLKKK